MTPRARFAGLALSLGVSACLAVSARAADCSKTSVGLTPINDLGTGFYKTIYQGGLYPSGSNLPPLAHRNAGVNRAQTIRPRNAAGQLDPDGSYVLLSIGMSNTTQEFARFMQVAAADPRVRTEGLVLVDGAAGGQTAATWDSPADANYDRVRDQKLAPLGLSEAQVQAAWVKVANAGPTVALPSAGADAFTLLQQMGNVARALRVRYPNLKVVLFSSRIYAGYASTALNPEPYAYESGFAVKWLIEAQITQMAGGGVNAIAGDLSFDGAAPWIGWGPYLWADGLTPRSDGLAWACADLSADGTHPSTSGRQKVAQMLLDFLLDSPFSRSWFRAHIPGDLNQDGTVTVSDLLLLIAAWGPCPIPPLPCPADIAPPGPPTGDGVVGVNDLLRLIANWG